MCGPLPSVITHFALYATNPFFVLPQTMFNDELLTTSIKEEHSAKPCSAIEDNCVPKLTKESALQYIKALLPIEVTLSGMVIDLSLVLFNPLSPMRVTAYSTSL